MEEKDLFNLQFPLLETIIAGISNEIIGKNCVVSFVTSSPDLLNMSFNIYYSIVKEGRIFLARFVTNKQGNERGAKVIDTQAKQSYKIDFLTIYRCNFELINYFHEQKIIKNMDLMQLEISFHKGFTENKQGSIETYETYDL